jgi:hypothetical protein
MNFTKKDCELVFDTFDFYNNIVYEAEEHHFGLIENVHTFLEDYDNPTQVRKTYYKKKLNKSFSNLLSIYSKQNDCIGDMIKCHKKNKNFLVDKEIDYQSLLNLKNVTATLVEALVVHRKQINKLLS